MRLFCYRHHLKEDFKAKPPITAASTSGKRYSVGPSTFSVAKGSIKYPLKLTSRFSVSPTSLVGIQTAKSGSSSKDMVCQKETPKEQDKLNPSRSASRRESKSVENKSNEISLMCPLCKFSSTSREAIMQHVLDSH